MIPADVRIFVCTEPVDRAPDPLLAFLEGL